MITSKQRSQLKSIAANMQPIMQVGKLGIGDTLIKSLSDALEAREMIKITVLETAEDTPYDTADILAEALGADVVAVIGRKVVLYRPSSKKGFEHLL